MDSNLRRLLLLSQSMKDLHQPAIETEIDQSHRKVAEERVVSCQSESQFHVSWKLVPAWELGNQ